ncbi:Heavy-metal-associated domain-containing protein [Lachnospiraceae bacterium YSD2013]|jgi:copper chaperone CopZ|nr:cation transporter [Lachnospiraceae bacterium]SCX16521.1 Heavy-metal-associated domain-containing protein [Lachnospiraceae bacterium YSD2013]MBO4824881.1 cation transporter [Lachnospiraceae bacterium]MBR5761721.1 cation transporter [Lachnospiraceae bacterium]MBR5993770.1 cation transporter [Lachnospiraceae bacterium]
MKKTFILEDLDCAHCAQKIEDKVASFDGVSNCKVTFLTQKLVYDVEDDKDKEVEEKMRKFVKETEPDVTVKKA